MKPKGCVVAAHPLLVEENWAPETMPHNHGDGGQHWREHDGRHRGRQYVEDSLQQLRTHPNTLSQLRGSTPSALTESDDHRVELPVSRRLGQTERITETATILHITTTDVSLELLLGPQLRAFRAAGHEVVLASAPGPYSDALVQEGFRHIPLRYATRSFAPQKDALALYELYRVVRDSRPDIVHTHNPKPGVYGRIAARLAGAPLVVNTQHGLYAQPHDPFRRRAVVYALERLAAAFSDCELVQSSEDLQTLERLRVQRRKLRLLGNGIDLERFRFRPEARTRIRAELGVGPNEVLVGSAGRLVAEKGFLELFDAAERLHQTHPSVKFAIAGPSDPSKGDPIGPADIAKAEAVGIRLLGMRSDIEDLYSAFDVFVLASHREGFPRTVMEAAATGVPVVATDIRGCRQAVAHDETGLLVPQRQPIALAAAIGDLAVDPARRELMRKAARQLAEREFDQQRVIERTLTAYQELLHD